MSADARWRELFRRAAHEPETLTFEEWRIVLMDVVEHDASKTLAGCADGAER